MASKIAKEIEEKVVIGYQEGKGTMELSKEFNIHRATVQKILQRNNVELRKRTPENKYNIHFFDNFSKESCYWAGFIAADGNVRSDRNSLNIHLAIKDLSHLQKFAKVINFTGNIEQSQKDCRISVSGKWFIESLEKNFNIVPRKTKILEFPQQIPEEFLPDYIRGYFDGDGCISQVNDYLHISFTSGSTTFLNEIINYFFNKGILINNENGKPKIYESSNAINYFCQNAFEILKILYENSHEDIRLARKYNKYIEHFV